MALDIRMDDLIKKSVAPGANAQGNTFQSVAFVIGEQHYCIDIMSVREIRNWTGVTGLPNTAAYMMGVINLRGVIVPIIDLKARFGLGSSTPTPAHVVVVVALGERLHGLLVDSVSDIVTCKAEEVSPIPEAIGQSQNPLLSGLITIGDQMMAVIALDKVIAPGVTGSGGHLAA
jgi:purine-binding chemotaxis protein CheW